MTLRRQLLLVSLLLLSLPWAGCQFVREMEGAMRLGQSQALLARAEVVASVLAKDESLLYPQVARRSSGAVADQAIYAPPAPGAIILDGYGDGWDEVPTQEFGSTDDSLAITLQAQTQGERLFLLFQVIDDKVIYDNPGLSPTANGDRLVLRLWQDNRRQDYVIATAAPGSVRARAEGRLLRGQDPSRITGFWQDSMQGYSLELELPLSYTGGRLGFFIIDEDDSAPRGNHSVGNTSRLSTSASPWLIYHPDPLLGQLSAFSGTQAGLQVIDRGAWLRGVLPRQVGTNNSTVEQTFWLLRWVYRHILASGDMTTHTPTPLNGQLVGPEVDAALAGGTLVQRYRDGASNTRTLLSAAAPIKDERGILGAVIVRESSETYLSLTDQAFTRLLSYTLGALGIAVIGLFAFATTLSVRIRRLSRAAADSIAEDGRISGAFKPSRAADEIGDLSRHYNELLSKLKEYNDYLHSLSRKLSHELRTPIAVIQSSLDNLEHMGDEDGSNAAADAATRATYLTRAREGLRRLSYILTAMSEANRLEESVRNEQRQLMDLVPLLNDLHAAHRELYPSHELRLTLATDSALVLGVPELLAQALDKLLDNAASFAPPGAHIDLRLVQEDSNWCLEVSNEGPPLAQGRTETIFEPMVSDRQESGDVHLGLGLHIVRLIVDYHRGSVRAANLPGDQGVVISITLPAALEISSQTSAV